MSRDPFLVMYPELKNARWRSIFMAGRKQHIQLALNGELPSKPPLYSYSQTYQSLFEKGWNSVRPEHIAFQRQKRDQQFHPRIQQIMEGKR
ncbi:hypothetical protein [Grimontia hollisae]|uniref:hypothetical protein n=1 Tax=Grimontia hollisae TaxID=673 RepID=UPI000E05CF30|nr:hypothetical protein [Grimontia hollisae]STQ75521.1 Uncharacterised protein [Grimontia hollisae]